MDPINATRKILKPGLLLLLAIAIAAAVAFRHKPKILVAEPAPRHLEFVASDLSRVELADLTRSVALQGGLNPYTRADIQAQTGGEVSEVLVRAGEQVQAGQLLARLDHSDLENRLLDRQGALAAARAQLQLAKNNRDNSETLLKKHFISRNAFDSSQSAFSVNQANVDSLEAQIRIAKKALLDSQIRAPFAGVISERSIQPGERVETGGKLFTLVDLRRMEWEAQIPTAQIASVRAGQPVEFQVDGFGERIFRGKIDRINPTAQPGSRSIPVYIAIDNSDFALKGGMFGKGSLAIETRKQAKALPVTAISQSGGKAHVFCIKGGVLRLQSVTLGLRDEARGLIEITSGLEPGDLVVNAAITNLHDGDPVALSRLPGN